MRIQTVSLRHILLASAFAGSLTFGAAQALASPSIRTAADACYNYPDPDTRCNKLCRASGGSSGFCDQEDGFCICTL